MVSNYLRGLSSLSLKTLAVVGAIFAVLATDSLTASAQTPPSVIRLPGTAAYRNVLEDGDLLVLADYYVAWAEGTQPSTSVADEFIFRLTQEEDVLAVNPLTPFFDYDRDGARDGYGAGIGSFYLSPARTAELTWTNAAGEWIEWPPSGTLTVNLLYKPPTTPASRHVLTDSFFEGDALGEDLIMTVAALGTIWAVELVSGDGVLTSVGATYLLAAVPGFGRMAPELAIQSVGEFQFPNENEELGQFAARAGDDFEDAPSWWGGAFEELDKSFGLPSGLSVGLGMVILAIVIIVGASKVWGGEGVRYALAFCLALLLPVGIAVGVIPGEIGFTVLALLLMLAIAIKVRDWIPSGG